MLESIIKFKIPLEQTTISNHPGSKTYNVRHLINQSHPIRVRHFISIDNRSELRKTYSEYERRTQIIIVKKKNQLLKHNILDLQIRFVPPVWSNSMTINRTHPERPIYRRSLMVVTGSNQLGFYFIFPHVNSVFLLFGFCLLIGVV